MHPRIECGTIDPEIGAKTRNRWMMKPDQALQLGRVLKARREARGLSTHRLARATEMDQATIVRLEAGSIVAPRPDKLSRIAQALGISGADVFAMADYTVPTDLPSLRPYLIPDTEVPDRGCRQDRSLRWPPGPEAWHRPCRIRARQREIAGYIARKERG